MTELLNCPFCGAKPHHGPTKRNYGQDGEPIQGYKIWCPHSCAQFEQPSRELAITAWNRRRASPPLLDAPRVNALDLANVMRDAFLAGRGLEDGDKLSEADSIAWASYAPKDCSAYYRLYAMLNSALQSDGEGA